jgi:tetratricopeptide (TPR) repeat protein
LKKSVFFIGLLLIICSRDYLISQDQNDFSLFQVAQSYERSADPEGAQKIYKKLYDKYPNYKEFYDSYRRSLEYFKSYDEAIKVINKWLITRPNDIEQLAYLGVDYSKLTNQNEAESAWKRAINISPKNINTYRTLAAVVLESRLYDKALEFYLAGRKECNQPDVFIVEVASLYAILQDYESAIKEYVKILRNDPNQLGYMQSLMVNYIEDPSFLKLAISVIKDEIKENKNNISFYYLLSWFYNEQKNYAEALNIYLFLEKVKNSNGLEIFNFAERAYRDNAFEIAAKAYKTIIDEYPKSPVLPNSKFGYAMSLEALNNNKSNLLIDSSLTLNKNYPSSEVIPLYSGVINLYDNIAKEYPRTNWAGEALIKTGNIKFEKFFDLDGALAAYNSVAQNTPNVNTLINSILKSGEILVIQNKIPDAALKFESIYNYTSLQDANRDMAKFKLSEIYYFTGNFSKAVKQLEEITKNISADFTNDALLLLSFIQANRTKDSTSLIKYAKAELLERQRKPFEAVAIFKDIAENNPQSGLIDEALMKIAAIYGNQKNYSEALRVYNQIIQQFPEGSFLDKVLFSVAEIYQYGLKDNMKAIEVYDKLLKIYPNSFYALRTRKQIRELRGEGNL